MIRALVDFALNNRFVVLVYGDPPLHLGSHLIP